MTEHLFDEHDDYSILFHYESPNAYLAWTELPKSAERHSYGIEPVPIVYGSLLDDHGQLGPGQIPD